jgi:mannose-6-phosphate isomerase-like protein (cupin superfamily)
VEKINLEEKFALFGEHWHRKSSGRSTSPKKKSQSSRASSHGILHEREDEMFYVFKGVLTVKFKDKDVRLREGEGIIIPKGSGICRSRTRRST